MRLLACVNLRDEAVDGVIDGAARIGARAGARIDLLFVDEMVAAPMWVNDPVSMQLLASRWDEVRAAEQARLEQLRERIPEEHRGTVARIDGRPADVIPDNAAGYDAVVLAGRRHSALGRALLGSVAARVARASPVPVFVLPPGATLPEGELHACFGVDLRAEDAGVGWRDAAAWAERLDARLDVVHVDEERGRVPHIDDPEARRRFDAEWQRLHQQDLDALTRMLADLPEHNRGFPRIEEGSPAEVLSEAAEAYGLLVVTTHGRTGVQRLLVGSVAEKVMQTCTRPLLLLRAPRG